MIYAYDKLYLSVAQKNLACMLDYMVNNLKYPLETAWQWFCMSNTASRFERGDCSIAVSYTHLAASHTEAEHQKLYTAACTDAGECLRAKCLADNRRINDVIRLLQQISDEKRKGKREHQLYRISLYHRCCHKKRCV